MIKQFTLSKFDQLQNIKRRSVDKYGELFVGDRFECDEQMAKYLTGNNENNKIVVKIIEIIPKKTKKS